MFTGIIDHCGTVLARTPKKGGLELVIKNLFSDLALGESIAIDGVCLTVTAFQSMSFTVEISPETLALTTISGWVLGSTVNLERAMLPTDRLGGHFVSGHVDQTVFINEIQPQGEFIAMSFSGIGSGKQKLLSPKGSITINGVSLTVNNIEDKTFRVMLIPHTLERTNLNSVQQGDLVNLEYDTLAKMVSRQLEEVEA